MKIVATFSKPEEAYMLRAQLEGSGIPAFVRDADTISTDWMLSNAIGGVKVEVSERDFQKAAELISDFRGDDENKRKQDNKKKHSVSRYVKISLVASILIAMCILLKAHSISWDTLGFATLSSTMLGGMVGLMCGLLDI